MKCWKEPTSKHAFVLSWASTIITIVFAFIGIVYYRIADSTMCLVFGLENLLDFLSSVVVLWRFWASGKMTKEQERTLKRRELRASMAISIILAVLGVVIIGTSSYDIASGPGLGHELDIVLFMAGTSVIIFGSLALFKFQYASALGSEVLYKDGVCSLIGTILAASLLTNTLLIRKRPDIWWLDPCAAMICGFSALFLGFHSIYIAWRHRRVPIFSLSWWMMSRGDGNTNDRRPQQGENIDNNVEHVNYESQGEKDGDDDGEEDKSSELEMKVGSTNLSNEIV